MNPKDTGDIGTRAAGGEHGENLRPLMRHQLWPPATPAALFASRLQTGAGSLANHGPLEFGERAEHVHHHASSRAGGVDRLGQGAEVGTRSIDLFQDVKEILERAR